MIFNFQISATARHRRLALRQLQRPSELRQLRRPQRQQRRRRRRRFQQRRAPRTQRRLSKRLRRLRQKRRRRLRTRRRHVSPSEKVRHRQEGRRSGQQLRAGLVPLRDGEKRINEQRSGRGTKVLFKNL